MEAVITGCGLLAIAIHLVMAVYCSNAVAAMVCFDVLLLYLCRYFLRRRACSPDGRLRFRLRVAIVILYMLTSALFFLRFSSIMRESVAVFVWAMAMGTLELGFAFLFPYSCIKVDEDLRGSTV